MTPHWVCPSSRVLYEIDGGAAANLGLRSPFWTPGPVVYRNTSALNTLLVRFASSLVSDSPMMREHPSGFVRSWLAETVSAWPKMPVFLVYAGRTSPGALAQAEGTYVAICLTCTRCSRRARSQSHTTVSQRWDDREVGQHGTGNQNRWVRPLGWTPSSAELCVTPADLMGP